MIISTNFKIETDKIDFTKLEADFQLCKYEFENFKIREKNDRDLYVRLIVAYKDAFDYPFYFYKMQTPASFYVLYPKSMKAPNFNFEELGIEGNPQVVNWQELLFPNEKGVRDKIHILVKILLAQYLYEIEKSDERKVCQSHFYVFGKQKGDFVSTSVEFEIKHDKSIGEKLDEFHIVPKATDFVYYDHKIDFEKRKHFFSSYFEKVDELPSYFRQLRPNKIEDFIKSGGKLYKLKDTKNKTKSELEWHLSGDNVENTRGHITYHFQKKFINFLNTYLDKVVTRKVYNVDEKYKPEAIRIKKEGYQTGLPISQLRTVYVFDNRMRNAETGKLFSMKPCSEYVKLLNDTYKNSLNITFEEVKIEQLSDTNFLEPLLVLHDVGGKEFKRIIEKKDENGELVTETILSFLGEKGFKDPKTNLYTLFKHIPKQSINVNLNEPFTSKGEERFGENWEKYFDYDIFNVEEKKWVNKLKVCLNDLYLKTFIKKQLPVVENNFPLLSERTYHKYMRIQRYVWQFDKVLLHIEHGKFQFIDLEKVEGKLKRKEILENLNLDWNEIIDRFKSKNYGKFDDLKMAKSRFIFASNVCIEIDEIQERVLFDYDAHERGNIRSGKRGTVQTDSGIVGIYFDSSENKYVVGHKGNPKFNTMERATVIRKLDFYRRDENFNHEELLETMSVQFVRNEQYTVYPLFFDLIGLYKEML